MGTVCYSPVGGEVIRLTRLDNCFRPIFGGDSSAVSDGFITVTITALTTESNEIATTKANGKPCVLRPAETSITGYSVEIQFCQVDPELYALATNQPTYQNYRGDTVGLKVNTARLASTFALELWTGSADAADACEDPDAEGQWGYLLLPALKGGYISDLTIEDGAGNFTITGASSRNGTMWGVGPYGVMRDLDGNPAVLPEPLDRNDHFLPIVVDVAPPEPFCGTRPLLDPTQDPITAVAGSVAGAVVTFAPTPDDIAAPAWYDFGDGNWAYLPASALGATTHTYAKAGTYTVRVSTNGIDWATTTVTTTVNGGS